MIASGCFAAAGYSLSDTTIITYATSSSSGSTIDPRTAFPSGDGGAVYDNKGNYIGTVSSSNANSITLTVHYTQENFIILMMRLKVMMVQVIIITQHIVT